MVGRRSLSGQPVRVGLESEQGATAFDPKRVHEKWLKELQRPGNSECHDPLDVGRPCSWPERVAHGHIYSSRAQLAKRPSEPPPAARGEDVNAAAQAESYSRCVISTHLLDVSRPEGPRV